MARPKRQTQTTKVTLRFESGMARRLAVVSAATGRTKADILETLFNRAYGGWAVHTRQVPDIPPENPPNIAAKPA
jgi:hypothetical protein